MSGGGFGGFPKPGVGGSGGGGATTIDNTGFEVLNGTTPQTLFDETDTALLNARSTGVRLGGALSDLGAGVVRITSGAGGILDNTDTAAPDYSRVTWAQQDIDLSAGDATYFLYIDSAGTLQQTVTEPDHAQYRTAIWLHRVSIRGGVYSASTSIVQPLQQYGPQMWDLWRAIGLVKSGLELSPAATDLTVKINSGAIFQPGANFFDDPLSPSEVQYPTKDPLTFRHVDQNGVQTTDRTTLDVGNYDSGGTITAIPGASTRVSVFTVMQFPGSGGNVRVFYGQAFFNNATAALRALNGGTYAPVFPSAYANAITLGWIIATKDATDLSDGTQLFVQANRFGAAGGGAVGAGLGNYLEVANNLSDLTDTAAARANLGLDAAVTEQTGAAYTFALSDANSVVQMSNAADITATVPPDADTAFPVGTFIEVHQTGAGAVTLAAGAGVTINSRDALLASAGQYAALGLRKTAADTWLLTGDLA